MPPSGDDPGRASLRVAAHLLHHEQRTGHGRAYPDGTGFRVNLPHRESFSPDAAYHVGPSTGMRFLEGAPIFAVEVRSENDYGPAAERAMAQKRTDYLNSVNIKVLRFWNNDVMENIDGVYSKVVNTVDELLPASSLEKEEE